MSAPGQDLFQNALKAHRQGDTATAERLYGELLRQAPNDFNALHLLGVIRAQQRKFVEADRLIAKALQTKTNAEALNNHGSVLVELGRYAEAIVRLNKAILIKPDYADAHFNLGNALRKSGQPEQAATSFEAAITIRPQYAAALQNLSDALRELDRPAQAISALRRAIELRPRGAQLHYNLGVLLRDAAKIDEAAASYRRAIELKPDFAEAYRGLAGALLKMGHDETAAASCRRAIELKPDFAEAYLTLGEASRLLQRLDEAAASFRRALELRPEFGDALALYVFMQRMMCDWRDPTPVQQTMVDAADIGERGTMAFAFLTIADDPASQMRVARHDSRALGNTKQPALWQGQKYEHRRIRLAYLSADFHQHATAYLMAELFERHDRSRFELYAVSFGRNDSSPMHRRLTKAFDHFIDVSELSNIDAAARIRSAEIDIAVDLKGYTEHSRPRILGHRPAPIQVSYLGYPGTMGTDSIDYILVDPFVVPADQQPNFTEKLVHLPECYQVNDSHREIAERTPSRAECELPEQAFVFCCFNNNFKLTPAFFDIWMRLLKGVSGSVLWLLGDNGWAMENLRREARARGVAAERLIFAPRMPLAEHLARHRLADLFLDTLPYNAHTTASDALWVGLPVLTCVGAGFAARVAGSLLHAIGLPELVTRSLDEYEELALRLATQPAMLQGLRERLAHNRLRMPLFQTDRFRRHIEAAYEQMWSIWQRGEPPRAFAIEALDKMSRIDAW